MVAKNVSEKKKPRGENCVNHTGGNNKFLKEFVIIALESFPLPAMTAALEGPRPGSVFRPGPPAAFLSVAAAPRAKAVRHVEQDRPSEK